MSEEVERDVLKTEKAGRDAKAAFVHDRLDSSTATLRFYDLVQKLKLRTMDRGVPTLRMWTC